MYINNAKKEKNANMMNFSHRIERFRDSLVPGMYLTVYLYTGDQDIDKKPRKAKVIRKYRDWVELQDENGFRYGPTYSKLLIDWGNN